MRLSPLSRSDLIRRLRSAGWQGPISGGKHQFMAKEKILLTIPNLHRGDIGPNLLKTILDEAGISRDEWFKLR